MFTVQNENELMALIRENCTYTEFNSVMEANMTEKGRFSIMQGTFNTIISSISRFLTKESRAKLLEKSIEASHGDITKIGQINDTTLKCLKILEKSKNSETRYDVRQAKDLYEALKRRKDAYKLLEHKKNNADSSYEKFMAYLMYLHYVLNVKLFVNYVALILAHDLDGHKLSDLKGVPFTLRKLVKDELDAYKSGNIDKAYKEILENKKGTKEDALLIAAAVTAAGLFVLVSFALSIRILTFYFYYTRMSLADYFEEQASFLRIHETELKKNKNLTKVESDAIIDAQRKWADRFSSLAEMVVVDEIGAARKVTTETKDSNKAITPSNINSKNTGMDFF